MRDAGHGQEVAMAPSPTVHVPVPPAQHKSPHDASIVYNVSFSALLRPFMQVGKTVVPSVKAGRACTLRALGMPMALVLWEGAEPGPIVVPSGDLPTSAIRCPTWGSAARLGSPETGFLGCCTDVAGSDGYEQS